MNKIKKIIELNEFLVKHLGSISDIKKNYNRDMIYKISDNVLKNYKINFCINPKQIDNIEYKKYINELTDFIEKQFIDSEISLGLLLFLHFNILNKLTTTEKISKKMIGNLREKSKYISATCINGKIKRRGFTAGKFVEKEFKENIYLLKQGLDSNNKEIQFEAIIDFVLYNLFITHPFDNGNSKVFYILLDILLWKYDFFPVFIRNKKFYNDILLTFKKYNPDNNYKLLKNNFYDNLIYIYKNYQM